MPFRVPWLRGFGGTQKLSDQGPTVSLPWKPVMLVGIIVFVNGISMNVVNPFVPFMVADFFPGEALEEVGRYSGFVVGAYFVGQVVASFLWGALADRFGRRPVLLSGLLGTMASLTLFAFSLNLWWALGGRFLWGALNGNIGVAKTYISEACDGSNHARGMAVLGITFGLGQMVGPVVGGFLARPASKYALLNVELFRQFPYLLPCLFPLVVGIPSVLAAYFYLPETLPQGGHKLTPAPSKAEGAPPEATAEPPPHHCGSLGLLVVVVPPQEQEQDQQRVSGRIPEGAVEEEGGSRRQLLRKAVSADHGDVEGTEPGGEDERSSAEDQAPLPSSAAPCAEPVANGGAVETGAAAIACRQTDGAADHAVQTPPPPSSPLCKPRRAPRLLSRNVLLTVSIYALVGFIHIGVSTGLFPLWVLSDRGRGGFGLDAQDIGVIIGIGGPVQIAWQVVIYPWASTAVGVRRLLLWCVLSYSGFCLAGPLALLLPDARWLMWASLCLFWSCIAVSSISAFTSVFVLINNSCPSAHRGRVNGLGQTVVALARVVGPVVFSRLFAWTQAQHLGWPWVPCLGFWIAAVLTFLTWAMAIRMPTSLDHPYTSRK